MRNVILFSTLLCFCLSACKENPTPKPAPAIPDDTAIANTIHQFYAWYEPFTSDFDRNLNIVDNKGDHAKIDPAKQELLFKNLRASGLLSAEFFENEKKYAAECEAYWKSRGEKGDEPLTGWDYDRIFCGQDWDPEFFKKSPVAIENLTTTEAQASMSDSLGGKYRYDLKKENGNWLIAKITCPGSGEPLDFSGIYKSEEPDCPMELKIAFRENGYTYNLKTGKNQHKGKLKMSNSEGRTYLVFKGLYASKPKKEVEAAFVDGQIVFQNSGNAMNPYLQFKDCDAKYIHLAKSTDGGGDAPVSHASPSKVSGEEKSESHESEEESKNEKTAIKKKPENKPATPTITLNQKGEITLNGKPSSIENLRKDLQKALLASTVIPEEIPLKTTGETGMGTRAEVNTIINESIAGAKWVRKKAAIEALNAPVGKKLGTATQLNVKNFKTSGAFALLDAQPQQANGQAIDYSKTSLKKEAEAEAFADRVFGLLKLEKGTWKVLIYTLGSDKVAADAWVKKFGTPKSLFSK